jgi:protease-4
MIKRVFQWLVVLLMVAVFIRGVVFIVAPDGKFMDITKDHIAVLDISGVIYSSDALIKQMKELEQNEAIKAYLIRVNSPGGLVTPSQAIYDYFKTVEKPLYVAMGSTAASGGYMVSLPAEKVYAMPSTVTGSIGVIMQIPNFSGLYDKIGFTERVIKSGQFKDAGNPSRPMTPEEEAYLTEIVMDMYDQFAESVAESRGITIERAKEVGDGRIFTGRMALKEGLVDGLGSWYDLMDVIRTDLEMPELNDYIEYTPKESTLKSLLSGSAEDLANITGLQSGFYYMLEL